MLMQLNALNRRVIGLSGGGAKRNRRRVDGSSTDFDLGLHRLATVADGGGSGTTVTSRRDSSRCDVTLFNQW